MYKCSTPELPQATVLEASDFTCMVMQVSSLGGLTPKIQKGSAWFSGAKTGSAATPVSSPESQQACNPLVKPIQVLMSTSHPTTTHRWVAFPACFTMVFYVYFSSKSFCKLSLKCNGCMQLLFAVGNVQTSVYKHCMLKAILQKSALLVGSVRIHNLQCCKLPLMCLSSWVLCDTIAYSSMMSSHQ